MQGHGLFVGIGGYGRKSTAQFSSFISGCRVFQLEIVKNYDMKKDWPEDLVKLFYQVGVEG